MSKSKFLGGILLIVGTSLGGGMLALPVSTAAAGFTNSIFFLFFCWFAMTLGALLILEVNLRLPAGSNMILMAKTTLGLPGQMIAWATYLILFYTLLAAYISGGSDVFHGIFHQLGLQLPISLTAFIFTAVFGIVVYVGIKAVDYLNRGLMFAKLGVYLLLVFMISPYVHPQALEGGTAKAITGSLMILMSSFGFASIVPSLREYFHDDATVLRRVIIIGSFIPLICYVVWNAVIMGVVAREGDNGLLALMSSEHATSGLTKALTYQIHNTWISGFFGFFTSICMVTAFLAVSIGLFDFLADGLSLAKKGIQGKGILALTFIPPLAVVLFKPGIYLHAMSYAGICCVILLLLLPALMAWRSRKKQDGCEALYLVPGGSLMLGFVGAVSLVFLMIAIFV